MGALLLLLPLCAESSCQRCVLKDCNDAAVAFLPDQSCAEVSQFSMLAGFASKSAACRCRTAKLNISCTQKTSAVAGL